MISHKNANIKNVFICGNPQKKRKKKKENKKDKTETKQKKNYKRTK